MHRVSEVSGFILQLGKTNDNEGPDLITNLKMQKLVYYCQGFHLALYGKPLFPETIEAWEYGPVCPDLYQKLKLHKSEPLPVPTENYTEKFTDEELRFMAMVYGVYGQYSAWRLREITIQESPWKETPLYHVISHKKMKRYFNSQIEVDPKDIPPTTDQEKRKLVEILKQAEAHGEIDLSQYCVPVAG